MSDVIDRPLLEQEAFAKARLRIIDCDIHPSIHAHSDLNPFLPKRWQEHLKTYGSHLRTPYIGTTPYPRSSPLIARRDAWPPTGGPPGSDLAFMQKQHLDPLDVEFGILRRRRSPRSNAAPRSANTSRSTSRRAPTSRSAAAATGRSTSARKSSGCRSASTSAAMAATRRPAAAGRPIMSRSTSRTRIRWRPSSQAS